MIQRFASAALGPVNHYRVRCVVAKIVDGKALGAANIANIGKASNEASGDFGRNPKGRDAEQRLCRCASHNGPE